MLILEDLLLPMYSVFYENNNNRAVQSYSSI